MKKEKRVCPVCNKKFTPRIHNQKYCSTKCSSQAYNERRRRDWDKGERICPVCGKKFTPRSYNQKYCSVKCKNSSGNISSGERINVSERRNLELTKENLKRQIIKWLRIKPLTRGELSRRLDRAKETIVKLTDELQKEGYDIEYDEASKVYTLQTSLKTTFEPVSLKPIFRRTLKFGHVSDTHFGSKFQQPSLLKTAYKIMEDEGVAFVLHSGDLVDGKGVYRGQEQEVFLHGADEQADYTVEVYPKSTSFKTYIIAGNHDLSFKKLAGYNIVRHICSQRKDLVYCGDIGATIKIRNCNFQILHPSGGLAYARSYHPQKIIEGIVGNIVNQVREITHIQEELPHYLGLGHYHVGFLLPDYMGVCAVSSLCFQAQTPHLKAKGLHPSVGFQIIEVVFDENGYFSKIIPRFYKLNRYIAEKDY